MSVMNRRGFKVILPRAPDEFWQDPDDRLPQDIESWRRFAMLALCEDARWPVGRVARLFGRPPGVVLDCLDRARSDLRRRLMEPDEEDDDLEGMAGVDAQTAMTSEPT
jgi:hypothetical protein